MTRKLRTLISAGIGAALVAGQLTLATLVGAHGGSCGVLGFQMLGAIYWVTDSVVATYSDGSRLIFHDYGGIWAPGDYYSVCH